MQQYNNNGYMMQGMNPMMGPGGQQQNQPQALNPGKYKTQICRHFKNGNCSLNQTCHFAHGIEELRNFADPLPNQIPQVQPKIQNNYKSVKCKFYEQGFCKNVNNCQFAHGDQDLQGGGNGNMQLGAQVPQIKKPYNNNFQPNAYNNYQAPNAYNQPQAQQVVSPQQTQDPNSLILQMIIENLKKSVFQENLPIKEKLSQAQQMAQIGNIQGSTNIIMEIMNDAARTTDEANKYDVIYKNARNYYENVLAKTKLTPQQYNAYPQGNMNQAYNNANGIYANPNNQYANQFNNYQPQYVGQNAM